MDLRAKLLANRPRSSTPSKSKGLSIQPKGSIQGQVKGNGSNGNNAHGNNYTTAQEVKANLNRPSMVHRMENECANANTILGTWHER